MNKLYLIMYYLVGIRLPSSNNRFAKAIRSWLCKGIFKEVGKNVNIEKGVFFGKGTNISIGNNSGIGLKATVQGPLIIEDNVMMGPEVIIYTKNHNIEDTNIPMVNQGETKPKLVHIKDDVWIGARVVILPGVTIGKGSVIGACALITKDVEPYSIMGGVPAKLIKKRRIK